jgi:signal transduction histidine kinase
MAQGVGAMLLTSEALTRGGAEQLAQAIKKQPPWSDVPIVLLQGGAGAALLDLPLDSLGNVTLLERPAAIRSVVSAINTAVRARQRQYQIRDYAQTREQLLTAERSAREEAERVSHLKDEFLATLSHELRTPLNAISGWAQLLKMDCGDPQTVSEGIDVIDRNVRVQTQLIEDLLDMSRIISGKVRLDIRSVDLSEIIDNAIESVKPAANARGVRIEKIVHPLSELVNGDAGRLQQVIWNLLTNATKFSSDGGTIQVLLERVKSNMEVSVRDEGEGIEPAFLPYLFDRFSQADASTTRNHGGLGLGLSIVKNLIELHGGSVEAYSDGKGTGSKFTIAIPIRWQRAEKADVVRSRGNSSLKAFQCDAKLTGLKVLVVDDESDAREVVKRFLIQCGAVPTAAGSANAAVALLKDLRPDVIISDLGMPGRDGFDLIRELRASGVTTPALALTAFARSDDRVRAIEAGFQSHLPKPVEAMELVNTVARLAGRL